MDASNNQQKTSKPLSLKIIRKFDVAPEVVFDAFTKPQAMRVWWTEDTIFDIDLRVGRNWTITRKEGDVTYEMTGKYIDIVRPIRLKYTISMPQFSPNSDTVSIFIAADGDGGCVMTFTQSGPGISEELTALPAGEVSESEKGWQQGYDLMSDAWTNEQK
ncbi:MAG: SRPBCC domain-containing protein [Balneolaceae bacterium]|nr:SRPBCC domain-containing protein [Balneolaceae bacterium]